MSFTITGDTAPKEIRTRCKGTWKFAVGGATSKFTLSVSISDEDTNAPDWEVSLRDINGEIWNSYKPKKEVICKEEKEFYIDIVAPNGSRYGDKISVLVKGVSESGETDTIGFTATATKSISILKTQLNMERDVVDAVVKKAKDEKERTGQTDVYAMLVPDNLKGYVFVEGMDTDRMREKSRDLRKARAYVDDESNHGKVDFVDIEKYLTPKSTTVGFQEGDIVELVDGPFKNSKARVKNVDSDKEEITVELVEALVPIPVTVKGSSVRIVDQHKDN